MGTVVNNAHTTFSIDIDIATHTTFSIDIYIYIATHSTFSIDMQYKSRLSS